MKKLTLGIILVAVTSSATAENKLSAELLLGTADQKTEVGGFGSTSGDDTSLGIRGVYSANQNLSIELAYLNYGETDDTYIDSFGDTINDKASSTALNFGVRGIMPLDKGFSLNGRVGISFWDVEFEETDSSMPGLLFTADDDGNDFYFGVGATYAINPTVYVGLEYTITEMDVSIAGVSIDHEVKNLSLSLGCSL